MLGTIADIAGIASFLLTIILLIRSEKLRNEIVLQKRAYQERQSGIVEQLEQYREILFSPDTLSLKVISDMRKFFRECEINMGHMLSHHDRKAIHQIFEYLDKNYSEENRKEILKNVEYLSARFTKQEV